MLPDLAGRHDILGLGLGLDDIADPYSIGCDVDLLPIHANVAVIYELARGRDGRREARAKDDIVQA